MRRVAIKCLKINGSGKEKVHRVESFYYREGVEKAA
jgi:hypothetical protein